MFQKLTVNFVDDENDLHHECRVVGYDILNFDLVDSNFVRFLR